MTVYNMSAEQQLSNLRTAIRTDRKLRDDLRAALGREYKADQDPVNPLLDRATGRVWICDPLPGSVDNSIPLEMVGEMLRPYASEVTLSRQ